METFCNNKKNRSQDFLKSKERVYIFMIRNKADNHLAPRVQVVSRYLPLVGTLTSARQDKTRQLYFTRVAQSAARLMEVSDGGVSVRLTGCGGVRGSCYIPTYNWGFRNCQLLHKHFHLL